MTNSTIEDFQGRCQRVLQVAKQLHAGRPDWVTFFRETLGVDGAARSVFATQAEYTQFEKSKEFEEIQNLVASLRNKKSSAAKHEITKVITVRLPESLHESLKAEASEHGTSMNKLCISKLLQALSEEEAKHAEPPIARPATAPRMAPPATAPAPSPAFRSTYQAPANNGSDDRLIG